MSLAGALLASSFLFLIFLILSCWLLIETDYVSSGITEPRGYLWRVHTDRLHDLTSTCNHRVYSCGNTVNHDVDQQAGLHRRFPADHPGAAHLANCIVKGDVAVTALPDPPTKNFLVKRGRTVDVVSRNLDVAHLSV